MRFLHPLGVVVIFCAAVCLTLLALRGDGGRGAEAREPVPVALSVPVEIIHEGEAPSVRRIEVRP